jgi:hypothetical protein
MAQCLVPNCQNIATHNLSVRLRRPNTSAIWAPNCNAYLCNVHANQGYTVDIVLTPSAVRQITTNVSAIGGRVKTRTTNIRNRP